MLSAVGYFIRAARPRASAPLELTVAVLPLVSGGDSLERELAYGLSDEIATALVQVPGVRVMSRRTVATSREKPDFDPEQTGRALGAQFLVSGSLRESGGRLTVLATLVQAKDGALVWASRYDRSLDDLAAVREDIAKSVGDSLRRKSGAEAISKPARAAHIPAAI